MKRNNEYQTAKLSWIYAVAIGFMVLAGVIGIAVKVFEWQERLYPEHAARVGFICALIGCAVFAGRIIYLVIKK